LIRGRGGGGDDGRRKERSEKNKSGGERGEKGGIEGRWSIGRGIGNFYVLRVKDREGVRRK
jgi:hypothetical protein